jgi:hypothetical protein
MKREIIINRLTDLKHLLIEEENTSINQNSLDDFMSFIDAIESDKSAISLTPDNNIYLSCTPNAAQQGDMTIPGRPRFSFHFMGNGVIKLITLK